MRLQRLQRLLLSAGLLVRRGRRSSIGQAAARNGLCFRVTRKLEPTDKPIEASAKIVLYAIQVKLSVQL